MSNVALLIDPLLNWVNDYGPRMHQYSIFVIYTRIFYQVLPNPKCKIQNQVNLLNFMRHVRLMSLLIKIAQSYGFFLIQDLIISHNRINPKYCQIMGNSDTQCLIKLDKTFYFAGDLVSGELIINSPKKFACTKVLLNIFGREFSQFVQENANNKVPQIGNSTLIDTTFTLYQWGPKAFLHGQYVFPFSFRLPHHLPGSYNQQKSKFKAKIEYSVKAILAGGDKEKEVKSDIIVRQKQKEGEQMMYGEVFAYPKTCGCFGKGVSRICCYFQKNYYVPGQECIIICEADNTKCQISLSRVKIQFFKSVTLVSSQALSHTVTETINTCQFSGVQPHRSYIQSDAERKAIILQYPSSKQSIPPSTNGRLVKCEYYIKVRPEFSGCCRGGEECMFVVKVVLVAPEGKMEKIEAPEGWNPEVYRNSQIVIGYRGGNELLSSMDSMEGIYPDLK